MFGHFSGIRRNILAHINKEYLRTCTYNSTTDPHCPIFRLGDMIKEAGEDFKTMAENVRLSLKTRPNGTKRLFNPTEAVGERSVHGLKGAGNHAEQFGT